MNLKENDLYTDKQYFFRNFRKVESKNYVESRILFL